jgi:hypothetical protein
MLITHRFNSINNNNDNSNINDTTTTNKQISKAAKISTATDLVNLLKLLGPATQRWSLTVVQIALSY